jgi:hypothetical protein
MNETIIVPQKVGVMSFLFGLFFSINVHAMDAGSNNNQCEKYQSSERHISAISAVAAYRGDQFQKLCASSVYFIEAMLSQRVTPEGEIIPHVRVQLVTSEYVCMYMVRTQDKAITDSRCYSNWSKQL